ncbi:MAG: winged helix-turn-helix domain-containing protein [Hyellaceae cyanobacterium CSU_1_1]|nr:winged helix-turn-helix domain-containing protein [Pleurocapsa sp. CRU_1_2]NJR47806.1 winged helix-turn-helix domain-containing protein [Hyellaceae cyanobacterium CSU_1_1]
MLIESKKYSYRQLIDETGLSRSTLHRRIKVLKESGVPLTMGAILQFPTNWAFHDRDGKFYSSKTDYAVRNNIPYYEMFQSCNYDTNKD